MSEAMTTRSRSELAQRTSPATPAVLEPHADRLAERFGARFPAHPLRAVVVAALAGFGVLAALMIGLGLLLTHVLIPSGVGPWDNHVNAWFVDRRTPTLDTWTLWGSEIAMTQTVIVVGLVVAIILAIARRWREVQFLVVAVAVEASAFLVTTLVIQRPRPTVPRLDISPPTSSFPSGHVAAGIALYVGLAIVLASHVKHSAGRALLWIVAIAIPFAIALSRVYRGMHHPTDVVASLIVLGPCALVVALFAARSGAAAARAEEMAHPAPNEATSAERKVA
jgi:membrane-associated phospholipid phosphatase